MKTKHRLSHVQYLLPVSFTVFIFVIVPTCFGHNSCPSSGR